MKLHLRTVLTTVTLLAATAPSAWSHPIDLAKARKLAQKYISQPTAVSANHAAAKIARIKGKSNVTQQPAYYVFNNANGKGFAIIPSDDRLGNVIGYSTTGEITDSIPTPLSNLLADYTAAVQTITVDSVDLKVKYPNRPKAFVKPVIGCQWNQTSPWNMYTPLINGSHAPVGCVATAMSQVLYFHKWPKERPEGMYKGDDAYGLDYYDWDAILPKYTGGSSANSHNASAVATLCRDVGQAVSMWYGAQGSSSEEGKAWRAFENKFGYSVRFIEKDVMPGTDFLQTVYNELSAGYPIFVIGGDHAFVYEGYDENGLVYVNWGWAGSQDGYYNIDIMSLPKNQYTQGKFYHQQCALLVRPKDGKHEVFTEQPIILTMGSAVGFSVEEKSTTLNGSLTASLGRVVAHNQAQGWDYSYTGEVGIGLFNAQGECLHVFMSPWGSITWANYNNGQYLNSTTNNPWKLQMSEVKDIVKNGRYYLRPMCHRQLNETTNEWESWRLMLNGNALWFTSTDGNITLDAADEHAQLSIAECPEMLTQAQEGSGDLASFVVKIKNTSRIDARAHVRLYLQGTGDLANEKFEVPSAYTGGLFLAKNRSITSWILMYPTSYSTSTASGSMKAGTYTPIIEVSYPDGDNYFEDDVTDSITVNLTYPDFTMRVFPRSYQGNISVPSLMLYNGDNVATTQIFEPQEIKQLSIGINTKVSSMRNDYITLPMRYRLKNLTNEAQSLTSPTLSLTMPFGESDMTTASRWNIPTDQLRANSTYEIHVEMQRDGEWYDYWNYSNLRRQFSISATNPIRNAENKVGGFTPTDQAKLQALYDAYATTASTDNYDALNEAINNTPRIAPAPMQAYRLCNLYTDNSTLYLSADANRLSGQNEKDGTARYFALVPGRKANAWRIYSLGAKKYVGALPDYGTEATLTDDINEAADFYINPSSSNYTVTLTAADTPDATYNTLHLGKRNCIEPWTPSDASAYWYMERVDNVFVDTYGFNFIDACDYATTYLPYAFTMPQGVTGGVISGVTDDGYLQVDYRYASGAIVPAQTALLLKGEVAKSFACTLQPTNDNAEAAPTSNLLHGSLTDALTNAEGDNLYYKFALNNEQNAYGFYWAEAEGAPFVNKAYKAYLALPRTQAASLQREGFTIEGTLTGIHALPTATSTTSPLYDLQGRRIMQVPNKGIYITADGKKLIRK